KQFLDIVKELPDQEISLSKKENNWVELRCDKSHFTVISISPEQFPALPNFEDKNYIEVRKKTLIDMIDRTQFAASLDTARSYLNGILLENLGDGITRMVATDSHRLSFVDDELFLNRTPLKKGAIIPKKG